MPRASYWADFGLPDPHEHVLERHWLGNGRRTHNRKPRSMSACNRVRRRTRAQGMRCAHSKKGTVGYKDIGLGHHDIYRARIIRDAEARQPGIVRQTVEEKLQSAQEPRRSHVMRAAREIARPSKRRKQRRTGRLGGDVACAEAELPAVAMDNVAQILDLNVGYVRGLATPVRTYAHCAA